MKPKSHEANPHKPNPGEMVMKEFLMTEAVRLHISSVAVYRRIMTGKYGDMKLRHINKRVVFLTPPQVTT